MIPDFVAHALVYNDIEGEDNHAQVCQQCRITYHADNKFTINMAYLDTKMGAPNYTAVRSNYPRELTESHDVQRADVLQFHFMWHDCFSGCVVVRNDGNDVNITTDFCDYLQYHPDIKNGFTMSCWSQQGLPCLKHHNMSVAELLLASE